MSSRNAPGLLARITASALESGDRWVRGPVVSVAAGLRLPRRADVWFLTILACLGYGNRGLPPTARADVGPSWPISSPSSSSGRPHEEIEGHYPAPGGRFRLDDSLWRVVIACKIRKDCSPGGEHGRHPSSKRAMQERTFGDFIREARIATGQSLRDLAKALEISPSYLSDIENDRRVPSEDVLGKLAALLALDRDELMALAGRFGDEAERYLRRHPTAGSLFRKISEQNLPEPELRKLLRQVEKLGPGPGKDPD
jgi:transcriptional regulator with XRE-family HTH domain